MIAHNQLIGNFKVRRPPGPMESHFLDTWFRRLIHGQGMTLMKDPQYAYLYRTGLQGWSAAALIETSHVAMHTWDETDPADLRLDFYSCSKLDPDKILEAVSEFGIASSDWWVIDRENTITKLEPTVIWGQGSLKWD